MENDVEDGAAVGDSAEQGDCCKQRLAPYVQFARSFCADEAAVADCAQKLELLDREVRLLLMQGIQEIELHAKAQYAQAMADAHGERCLYDARLFTRKGELRQARNAVKLDIRRRMSPQVGRANAVSLAGSAPIGLAMDCCSLAPFARLYGVTRSAQVRERVARAFSANAVCLSSWLTALVGIRNRCAHFEPFIVAPCLPKAPKAINGIEGDPSAPLYAVVLVERFLSGRVAAEVAHLPRAEVGTTFVAASSSELQPLRTARSFQEQASQLLGAFALEERKAAVALRMPPAPVGRYMDQHVPRAVLSTAPRQVRYGRV